MHFYDIFAHKLYEQSSLFFLRNINFSKLKRKKQHCDNLTCKTSNKKKTSDDTKSQAVTTLFHWNFFVHVHIESLCFFAYTLFGHRGQSIVDNGRLYAMYSIWTVLGGFFITFGWQHALWSRPPYFWTLFFARF